jgi:hypothetical protein
MSTRRAVIYLIVGALLAGLAGCASPTASFKARAILAGLSQDDVAGAQFEHVVFWNGAARRLARGQPAVAPGPRLLHIYLDGDGTPWHAGHPTADPTPRNPLMLQLIPLDSAPAVLLGRPCFEGLAHEAPCNWTYWNDARYAEPIVASMTAAMDRLVAQTRTDGVILFGASGGGALAVLMGDRSNKVRGIVTIAANLDLTGWLAYHGYSGLKESLNPAVDGRRHMAEHADVFERHYVGGRDIVVPPATQIRGLRAPSEQIVVPDYDHNCCWARMWPQILAEVDRATAQPRSDGN